MSLLKMNRLSSEQKTKVIQFSFGRDPSSRQSAYTAQNSTPRTRRHLALSPDSLRVSSKPAQLQIRLEIGENQSFLMTKSQRSRESLKKNPNALHPPAGPASQPIKICYSKHKREKLKLHPRKIPYAQGISPEAQMKRKAFSEWFIAKCADSPTFPHGIWSSDESHVYLHGSGN